MSRKHRPGPAALPCPCGLLQPFAQCCGPYLAGTALPATPEALMRSRYTAYHQQQADYLRATWHPSTCPATLLPDDNPPLRWQSLTVHTTSMQNDQGSVCFSARYKVNGKAGILQETSRFVLEHGRWWYLDGIVTD
jgi:SEC-C motif-containing protein